MPKRNDMEKTIEIPEGYEARIEGNKVILEPKESEDERIREVIESIIRVYGKAQGEWIAGYDMDTLVVHLRDAFACLEKQKEQKPTEWSEEDSNMICEIIDHCITIPYIGGTLRLNDERKKELKTFVKSLHPHWKPSEEQMKHLKSISVGWHPDLKDCQVLSSLYKDLKKL